MFEKINLERKTECTRAHSLRERFLVFLQDFLLLILIYQFANFSAAFVDTTMTVNTMPPYALGGGSHMAEFMESFSPF